MDKIREYASKKGMNIIRVYSDEGKSGLRLKGRKELQKLISEVIGRTADFKAILVYDVSRWGRFQDADEGGHFEYLCKCEGIPVHYCAEQFENDGSSLATMAKGFKRWMAGEYSRELSTKVFDGACRLVKLGFRQGGTAGYGLRRMLVDETRQPKQILVCGEHKSIQTDRVILVPGPPDEVKTVCWIYRRFAIDRISEREIANQLNEQGVRTDFGRQWTRGTIHHLLTNEKYIGNNIYHRTSFMLKQKHIKNPKAKWIRAEGVFEPIVEVSLFWQAQGIIEARCRHFTDDEMLEKLKTVLQQHGKISGLLIDEHEGIPSSSSYRSRFGSLVRAYRLIGYTPEINYAYIEANRLLRKQHPQFVQQIINILLSLGATVAIERDTEYLLINDEYRAVIMLARCMVTEAGSSRWHIRFEHGNRTDITIAARMQADNTAIKDFYLIPHIDISDPLLRLSEGNGLRLDSYRFDNLDYFFALAERVRIDASL